MAALAVQVQPVPEASPDDRLATVVPSMSIVPVTEPVVGPTSEPFTETVPPVTVTLPLTSPVTVTVPPLKLPSPLTSPVTVTVPADTVRLEVRLY